MWYMEVALWICNILKAVFFLFILLMTVTVVCISFCAGRNRDWEEDDRTQVEALRMLKERDEAQK